MKRLQRLVQMDVAPKIDATEMGDALDANRLASTWLPDHAYSVNDVIHPATPNGHRYVCIRPGTSAHVDGGFHFWPRSDGGTIGEVAATPTDPALLWQEVGPAYPSTYDVRQAAYDLWDLKVQKASQFITDGDVSFHQVYDHCVEQRDYLAPIGVY